MTAIVIGATGLVGSELIDQLLSNEYFERVKIFTRRSLENNHPKLEEHMINFDQPEQWKGLVSGDVLFSALGTTLKKAGSKGEQFKIDYKYQYNFAKAALENEVKHYVLVSAAHSSPTSKIFYSMMKGILEKDIKKLSFQHIHIIRPGVLCGARKEKRMGEQLGILIFNVLHHIPGLGSLKPIAAATVAKAMINSVFHYSAQINEYSLGEIFKLAEKNSVRQ